MDFGQSVTTPRPHDPMPPLWRMFCRCSFRAGTRGEIAACACRSWWQVGKRGRWRAISKHRARRALLPSLRRDLAYFELTGKWPAH